MIKVKDYKSKKAGISSLLLVFVVVIICDLIILALLFTTYITSKEAIYTQRIQQAFFTAEGAFYDTVQRLRDDQLANPSEGIAEYTIDGVTLKRTISEEDYVYTIETEADVSGVKRTITGTLSLSAEQRPPLDIVLVLDKSLSMCVGSSPNRAIDYTKNAARAFVDIIGATAAEDRMALITFCESASVNNNLTSNFGALISSINTYSCCDLTDFGEAIYRANSQLNNYGRAEATKVIVFFSDGNPNRAYNACGTACGTNNPCLATYDTGYDPDNRGVCCTNQPVDYARNYKNNGKTIYTILLRSYSSSACGVLSRAIELGQRTMLRMSSEEAGIPFDPEYPYIYFKQTPEAAELTELFEGIAEEISSVEFFQLREIPPVP